MGLVVGEGAAFTPKALEPHLLPVPSSGSEIPSAALGDDFGPARSCPCSGEELLPLAPVLP